MVPTWLKNIIIPGALLQSAFALDLPKYRGLKTAQHGSVLEVTLHNPDSAINLWGVDFQDGMTDLVGRLHNDNETKVVIFKSDVPKFFCAHLDLLMPGVATVGPKFARLMYDISDLPQVTIGAVEGRARGGGNEFLLALDMRFASEPESFFGQIEVGTGLIPGGGGSQHLPRLIGCGLALEYLLSGNDINAKDAARLGWINKSFRSSKEMYKYIDGLTSRLRLFPLPAMAAIKKTVNARSRPTLQDLLTDAASFTARLSDPAVPALIGRALEVTNNLTLGDAELNLDRDLPLVYQ
ncbi:enoyl-CoA hydratase [Fusarium oxysporum f. sp. lycopersici 4287]|uniref:Enoyl-CoA hydratase n=2 Tax=Fusarium oxysporum TaxID=5507 RepID=A0A0J9W2G1_FUSO4|nr:enoyl-CoA hydratase [Fusarium oxysporum f. sp. lycopersici 4287]KNB17065.1 enoyl-CoA hydratase [Fusarium oxysporum f. sp. lycopersici 4287]